MVETIDEALLLELQSCKDLPTPPAVAAKIIELSGAKHSDIDTLASIVAVDPALSAKLLGIANSSLYMRRVEADSIQQAVAMFGWTGTLNLALSFAVTGAIRGNLTSGLDHDYVWRRSLAAAVSARKLGQVMRYTDEDVLFLPALLQDIGMLALDRAVPTLYENVEKKQHDHAYLQNIERDKVKTDHAGVGAWLLQTWKLPREISQLVGVSHTATWSTRSDVSNKAQKVMYLSGYLADCLVADDEFQNIHHVGKLVEQEMMISMSDFFMILGQAASQFLEMAAIFDIDAGNRDRLRAMQDFLALTVLVDS